MQIIARSNAKFDYNSIFTDFFPLIWLLKIASKLFSLSVTSHIFNTVYLLFLQVKLYNLATLCSNIFYDSLLPAKIRFRLLGKDMTSSRPFQLKAYPITDLHMFMSN